MPCTLCCVQHPLHATGHTCNGRCMQRVFHVPFRKSGCAQPARRLRPLVSVDRLQSTPRPGKERVPLMSTLTASVDLLPVARSIPAARHLVAETLSAWGTDHAEEDVALLVTELV